MRVRTQVLAAIYRRHEMARAHYCFAPEIPEALHERCARFVCWLGPISEQIVHRVAMDNIDDINIMHVRHDMPTFQKP